VSGTFSYSPAAGTVLPAGNDSLSVTFTPSDTTDYKSVTTGTTISVQSPPSVIYTISNVCSGEFLDNNSATNSGTPIVQNHYTGGLNQQWNMVPVTTSGANNVYYLVNVQSGDYLSVPTAVHIGGIGVTQSAYNGTTNQWWTLIPEANGTDVLQSYCNVMDLEDPGSSIASGTQVDQDGYYGRGSDLWVLHPVVPSNAQIATWSVSVVNGSTQDWMYTNMSSSWIASNEPGLENWLQYCDTPGNNYSMTVTATVYSSVTSGSSTIITATTSAVSIVNGVPSYEYFTTGTLTKPSYPEYYSLDIKDTGSTFTTNYVHNISGDYDFTIQTSLSQSTPASHFGAQPPLLEQLGSSDPYGLYFTDSLYETAGQRTTPYYSSWIVSNSGNLGLGWPNSNNYMIGEICPVFSSDSDAAPVPTFSTTRIGPSITPNAYTNYQQVLLGGGFWQESTSMYGSDWNYTWYAATTQPTS
jgi:hypothetical protein